MADAVINGICACSRREALVLGLALMSAGSAAEAQALPRNMRPQVNDVLVRAGAAPTATERLSPGDLVLDAPPVLVWPKDPSADIVRDGSRLNQVLLLRLDPETLDAETRPRSVDGVVAYSATCTHALCPVTQWRADVGVLHCACHNSEFDPRAGARVVGGPAPRRLPPLPLSLDAAGCLQVAQPFIGKVGGQTA